MKKILQILFVCLLFWGSRDSVFALGYFDSILESVSSVKSSAFKKLENFWSFGASEPGLRRLTDDTDLSAKKQAQEQGQSSISEDQNIFLDKEADYFPGGENSENLSLGEKKKMKEEEKLKKAEAEKQTQRDKQESYLQKVLEKLGLVKSNASSAQVSANSTSTMLGQDANTLENQNGQNPQNMQNQQNPFGAGANNNLMNGQNPYLNSPFLNGNSGVGVGAPPAMLATPYNGPGGSLPGDCGIPVGPVAYNIGGNSVRCYAESVVIGFEGAPRNVTYGRNKVFNMGYINPLIQKGNRCNYSGPQVRSGMSAAYGENRAADYSSAAALAYIDCQILHWKSVANAVGQKCIPVDIDNCDSIGNAAYLQILNRVENLNKSGGPIVKVFTKNPHIAGCTFLSHPAVVGAFIEEISPADAARVSGMRSKPEQLIIFARGGTGSNGRLKQLESMKIPNSAYSYDQGGEYQMVSDCTYIPGAAAAVPSV